MPQKHNLRINFFKSLELIFASGGRGQSGCKKTRLEAVDAGQRSMVAWILGAKRGGGREWGRWIALECVL